MIHFLYYMICIICFMLVMVFSLTFHKFSHVYVADLFGDHTAKNMGMLTLNPLKCLKPLNFLGTICIIFFGLGWTEPIPLDERNFSNSRFKNALVAAAGPMSNLFLVLVAIFYKFMYEIFLINFTNVFLIGLIRYIIKAIIYVNVSFFVFNSIPIPPLDGFNIISSLLPCKLYNFVLRYNFKMIGSFLITYLFFSTNLKKVIVKVGILILKNFHFSFI